MTRRVGRRNRARRAFSVTRGSLATSGNKARIPMKASTPSIATTRKGVCQFNWAPIKIPSGMPSTVATVRPARTSESARPRFSAGVSDTAPVRAAGIYKAEPKAASTFAATKTTILIRSNRFRSSLPVIVSSTGDPSAYAQANPLLSQSTL